MIGVAYGYQKHTPQIHTGSGWQKHSPYIWNGSAWVEQPSRIYGEITTITLLDGGDNPEVTGGWSGDGYTYDAGSFAWTPLNNGTADSELSVSTNGNQSTFSAIGTTNMIDLTHIKTLYATITEVNWGTIAVKVSSDKNLYGTDEAEWTIVAETDAPGTISIDVSSLEGSFYVVVAAIASATNKYPAMKVSKIWGEP